MTRYDVAVIGAGVFGAWTAWHLAKRGQRVALLEAYGPANARSSSAGETRIIRMGYGADEIYMRWSRNSLEQWKAFSAESNQPLFLRTGVLWLGGQDDSRLRCTEAALKRSAIPFETINRHSLADRYPQIALDGVTTGILEPESGVLLARRAVAAVVADGLTRGVDFRVTQIRTPAGSRQLDAVQSVAGDAFSAGQFVFACGPWLPKLFPDLLGDRIFPTRQEVFFFGVPPGDSRFAPPTLPTWLFQDDQFYGMPDIEGRGFKIAWDGHGERIDPDTQSRVVTPKMTQIVRDYVARRFPALRDAPVVETRVCQYENTSNGDFLIDRHPGFENVWLVGGGSGHGFNHGPAVGEYVAARLLDGTSPEPRFSLESKASVQRRTVY